MSALMTLLAGKKHTEERPPGISFERIRLVENQQPSEKPSEINDGLDPDRAYNVALYANAEYRGKLFRDFSKADRRKILELIPKGHDYPEKALPLLWNPANAETLPADIRRRFWQDIVSEPQAAFRFLSGHNMRNRGDVWDPRIIFLSKDGYFSLWLKATETMASSPSTAYYILYPHRCQEEFRDQIKALSAEGRRKFRVKAAVTLFTNHPESNESLRYLRGENFPLNFRYGDFFDENPPSADDLNLLWTYFILREFPEEIDVEFEISPERKKQAIRLVCSDPEGARDAIVHLKLNPQELKRALESNHSLFPFQQAKLLLKTIDDILPLWLTDSMCLNYEGNRGPFYRQDNTPNGKRMPVFTNKNQSGEWHLIDVDDTGALIKYMWWENWRDRPDQTIALLPDDNLEEMGYAIRVPPETDSLQAARNWVNDTSPSDYRN